jgi:AcrR family transcriptional regulator
MSRTSSSERRVDETAHEAGAGSVVGAAIAADAQTVSAGSIAGLPIKRIRARRGEGDRLRDEILDAAESLLMETGDAEAVSIRAISHIVRVSAPSIYRHFEDKDALVLATCERAYERFGEVLRAGAESYPGPLGSIMGRALAYVEFALANPGQYRVLFMSKGNLMPPHEHDDLFQHVDGFEVKSSGMKGLVALVEAVQLAIAEGLVQPVASAIDMSLMLWGQVHGIASLRIANPALPWPPVERQVETMFAMLAKGICTQVTVAQFEDFQAAEPSRKVDR